MYRLMNKVFNRPLIYWPLMTTVSVISSHYLSHERHRNGFKQLMTNIQQIKPQIVIKSTALINDNKSDQEIYDLLITSTLMIYNVGCFSTKSYPCDLTQGTGFAFSKQAFGYILTNYHVIEGAHRILIEKFQIDDQGNIKGVGINAKSPKGQVVYADPGLDLALVRIIGYTLPTYLELADEVVMGEPVVMVGNLEIPYCFTDGIVASVNRSDNSSMGTHKNFTGYQDRDVMLLTLSLASYPGCSGAPILNMKGQVVGVLHTDFWEFPDAFAATLSKVKDFIEKGFEFQKETLIIKYLYCNNKSLGIAVKPYNQKLRNQSIKQLISKVPSPKLGSRAWANKFNGFIVWEIFDITIDENHIKRFDVILKVNGNVINSVNDLKNCVNSCRDNEELSVTVMRNFATNDRVLKIQPKSIDMSII